MNFYVERVKWVPLHNMELASLCSTCYGAQPQTSGQETWVWVINRQPLVDDGEGALGLCGGKWPPPHPRAELEEALAGGFAQGSPGV